MGILKERVRHSKPFGRGDDLSVSVCFHIHVEIHVEGVAVNRTPSDTSLKHRDKGCVLVVHFYKSTTAR